MRLTEFVQEYEKASKNVHGRVIRRRFFFQTRYAFVNS